MGFALLPALAQVELGGELSSTAGVCFDNDKSVTSLGELELDVSGEVGLGIFPDADFLVTLRSEYDAVPGQTEVELGEAYARLFLGDFDVSFDQQLIAWGSANGIKPVDVLNPRDLRRDLLGAEKLPVLAFRAVYNAPENIKVDAVLLSAFRASRLPPLPAQLLAELPPGVTPDDLAPDDLAPDDLSIPKLYLRDATPLC